MKMQIYLITSKRGTVRLVKSRKNNLGLEEVCLKLDLQIPDLLFEKPQLQATIKVDEKACIPTNITPDIIIKTQDLIEQSLGMKIQLNIVSKEMDDKND